MKLFSSIAAAIHDASFIAPNPSEARNDWIEAAYASDGTSCHHYRVLSRYRNVVGLEWKGTGVKHHSAPPPRKFTSKSTARGGERDYGLSGLDPESAIIRHGLTFFLEPLLIEAQIKSANLSPQHRVIF